MQNTTIPALIHEIRQQASQNEILTLAIVGPPGAGKSTLAEQLRAEFEETSKIIPMDGFHFDNAILKARGDFARKGAPHTFDCSGFLALLTRLSQGEDVVIPVFDRGMDLARAGADIVTKDRKIRIVEGNYLLLKERPWHDMERFFDMTIFINPGLETLEKRLVQRWLDHGHDPKAARARALGNDIPNAIYVLEHSKPAQFIID